MTVGRDVGAAKWRHDMDWGLAANNSVPGARGPWSFRPHHLEPTSIANMGSFYVLKANHFARIVKFNIDAD